ncbi:MAG: hypothetical protein IKN74_00610 [Clostridia bacterium]|nr:hypothetical protein [Clostridia bacterium]
MEQKNNDVEKEEIKELEPNIMMIISLICLAWGIILSFFVVEFSSIGILCLIISAVFGLIAITQTKKTTRDISIATTIISILILIVLVIYAKDVMTKFHENVNNNMEETTSKDIYQTQSTQNNDDTNTSINREYTESEKMILKLGDLIKEGKVFDTGSYIAGEIPPGEYAFIKYKNGQYYSEEDKAGNIIDNENFDSFGYVKVHGTGNITTRGILIKIDAIQELGVSNAKEVFEKLNDIEDYNQGGYYKIGLDLPAGTYIVESIGGRGYYAIKSGPIGDSNIVKNNNFDGKKTVIVKEGQYLEVSRSTITFAQ